MKELVLRNAVSSDRQKREYSIEEMFVKDGVITKRQRTISYIITPVTSFTSWQEVMEYVKRKAVLDPSKISQVLMLHSRSKKNKSETSSLKANGTFYAQANGKIYEIAYSRVYNTEIMRAA
ncbi:MAG: hypothetical protein ABIH01_00705 [Candidatus Omnitrophota bacterium]